jgi:hypothetical protein
MIDSAPFLPSLPPIGTPATPSNGSPSYYCHLPEIAVPLDALHPVVRTLVQAGGGVFRKEHVGGYPFGVVMLTDNGLYPFGIRLVESDKGLMFATRGDDGELRPVLLVGECQTRFPMLYRAIEVANSRKAA